MRNKSVKSKRGTDLYSVGKAMQEGVMSAMRTAIPGIIQSFDGKTQTAVIQPAIRRRVAGADGGEVVQVQEPLLLDVPVMFLGGGVSALTFPVSEGDECLVIFADTNIDAWYQSGGVQNQVYPRSHSVADGFAIVGFRSKPKAMGDVANDVPVIDNLRVSGKLFAQIEGRIDRATDADNADKLGGFPASDYAFDSDVEALGTSLTYSMNDGFSTLTNWANNTFSVLGHDHEWSEIQSKPVVFPPSEHGHPWSAISEKPSTYPATTHGHVWGDLSNVPSIFPTDWDNVANKPSTFPATAHDHEWSEIQSKPATFPPSSHTHSYLPLTGGTITGPVDIRGVAASVPLRVRGIDGQDDAGNLGSLFLNYNSGAIIYCRGGNVNLDSGNYSSYVTPAGIGAAVSSHGNHVPATQTANNAVFLRNDNSWQTITPANIGAAASSHTHPIEAITDLIVGGTNVIKNSTFSHNLDGWTSYLQGTAVLYSVYPFEGEAVLEMGLQAGETWGYIRTTTLIPVDTSTSNAFMFSFYAMAFSQSWAAFTGGHFALIQCYSGTTQLGDVKIMPEQIAMTSTYKRFVFPVTLLPGTDSVYVFFHRRSDGAAFRRYFITKVKLEKGTVATDWSPSPADPAPSALKLTTARALTVGNTSKTFNGTGNVSWSLAEIGAQKTITSGTGDPSGGVDGDIYLKHLA